jgi:hypothetical protein
MNYSSSRINASAWARAGRHPLARQNRTEQSAFRFSFKKLTSNGELFDIRSHQFCEVEGFGFRMLSNIQ